MKTSQTRKFAVIDFESVKQPKISAHSVATPKPTRTFTKSKLSVEERVAVASSVGEEVITHDELAALFAARDHPIVYDGFEPSGRMHIAQGVLRAINVNKLTSAGCHFKFWVADWFAQLNNKMGGDLTKIKAVGAYMVEIWKAIGKRMHAVVYEFNGGVTSLFFCYRNEHGKC